MPGETYQGPFMPLNEEELGLKDELQNIIYTLAEDIGERNIWHDQNLNQASEYISSALQETGLYVHDFPYQVEDLTVKNIIAEMKGTQNPSEIIVLGAHYDTVIGSPGADDNASGIAALIVLAKLMAKQPLSKTIHFVAFVNEEMPFFYTKNMGSWQYANHAYRNKQKISAMFSLESIGYYSDIKGSQKYPFPMNFFYPEEANFIGFIGNLAAKKLVREVIGAFRQEVSFPSEGFSGPSLIPGVGWSDQWSFWKHGYQAIMITGTALYRNPYYHTEKDLPQTIDYNKLARVVFGLKKVFQTLYS